MRNLFYSVLLLLSVSGNHALAFTEDEKDYLSSNTRAIFYHELGHALIDILNVPIFGQEEDAADVLSALLIDVVFDEEAALSIAYDVANNFWSDAYAKDELYFWDTHGLDEQRAYNFVCLFYGFDPENREDFAQDFELPEERAITCEEERELAEASWFQVLGEVENEEAPKGLELLDVSVNLSNEEKFYFEVVKEEVEDFSNWLALPHSLKVRVARCDEPNAFYDPNDKSITMCTEFADYLIDQVQ